MAVSPLIAFYKSIRESLILLISLLNLEHSYYIHIYNESIPKSDSSIFLISLIYISLFSVFFNKGGNYSLNYSQIWYIISSGVY